MRRITRWRPWPSFAIGVLALFVALAGTALALQPSGAPGAQGGSGAGAGTCDAGTMRGVYAVHLTGTMRGQPLAVVGHAAFKGERRTSGVLTEVWNGQPSRYPFEGTYSLDADCRGELSFRPEHPQLPEHRTFEFYPSAGGKRAFFILTDAEVEGVPADGDEALSNHTMVLSGDGERLSRTRMTCDEETLRGAYAWSFAGMTTVGPVTTAGRAELDGEGGISLDFSAAAPHAVDRDNLYRGTYSVDPGCRGEVRLSGLEGPHFDIGDHHIVDFYVAARGERAFLIVTKTWVEEFLGIGVDPSGINEYLAQGNEQEFNVTFSGVVERR